VHSNLHSEVKLWKYGVLTFTCHKYWCYAEFIKTRKCGSCERIATWGRPTRSQSFSALTGTPIQSLKLVNLALATSYRFTADTIVTLTFDFVTLIFDFHLCIACHVLKLCAKCERNANNPRRSYCYLNIWPYDLEHVSRVALCSGIICTKFKLRQRIRSWNVTIYWRWYITWCDLDLWPLDLEHVWDVMWWNYLPNVSEIDQSAAELLTNLFKGADF